MGNKESNESAAVKRQAEGFSNPMYRMLDLGVGSSDLLDKLCCEAIICLTSREEACFLSSQKRQC